MILTPLIVIDGTDEYGNPKIVGCTVGVFYANPKLYKKIINTLMSNYGNLPKKTLPKFDCAWCSERLKCNTHKKAN